ncbi:MAG: hypothetical protein EOR94_02040 [Mesorhizobium sp.]|nr:MAG: hypothetical protein EOR94_02040 [Mesorhizobium sp.]
MITPKNLTAKLRSVPQAKSIFDKMAELPLWDAAYLLLRSEFLLNMIEFDAGLRNAPFVEDKLPCRLSRLSARAVPY